MSVDVITFGCRLNACESEVLRRHAEAAGLTDTVIVNTCAVTSEAVRQARQAIRRTGRERPETRIVVTGCAAQTEPGTFAQMPEVALVIGNFEKTSAQAWRRQGRSADSSSDQLTTDETSSRPGVAAPADAPRHLPHGRVRALLQVQNGCDHRCTFCIIPHARGASRSVPIAELVHQARTLRAHGYREIVLTGVDLTGYGGDLPDTPRLGTLVKHILRQVPDLERLRLSSVDSIEVDRDLVDAFATEQRLMPHLHLSLQSGDDLILKRMRRRHLRADAIVFCRGLRSLRPDIVFGADFIAGFPTESEAMFARTLDLIDECRLTYLHVFPFSPRPGTAAARMPQVPREVAKRRALALREKAMIALRGHLDSQLGRRHRVLAESPGQGRTEQFTAVQLAAAARPGDIVDVNVAGHDGRQLLAVSNGLC